jgi:hypothetical protein
MYGYFFGSRKKYFMFSYSVTASIFGVFELGVLELAKLKIMNFVDLVI